MYPGASLLKKKVRYVPWGLIAKDPVHEQTFVILKLVS